MVAEEAEALVLEVVTHHLLILVDLAEVVLDIASVDLLFIMPVVAAVEMKIMSHHLHHLVVLEVVEI